MSDKEMVLSIKEELYARKRASESLVDYTKYIDVPGKPIREDDGETGWVYDGIETGVADHHCLLLEKIQDVIEGRLPRLMVFMPPGSAKSTYCSSVAPTWAMGRIPDTKIILASYGGDLAKKHGRKARSIVKSKKYEAVFDCGISDETSAADFWATSNGSEYMSAGILSGITGNRAHGIIIDDPIRGRADADSKLVRDRTWDAYVDDLRTRLIPGGWEIIVQTRWHEDDLSGRILPPDYDGESGLIDCEDGRQWYVINLPAQCEREDDPLDREIGEYLWKEWFTPEHFEGFKRNARSWAALFQQRPRPDEGTFFKREFYHFYRHYEMPKALHVYMTSDFAVSADEGDFTEHGVWGVDEIGDLWMLGWWYGQKTADIWIEELLKLFGIYKPLCWFGEGGVIRRAIEPFLLRMMTDKKEFCRIEWINPVSDKPTRARAFQAMSAQNKVHFPDNEDGHRIVNQLLSFPVGTNDDAVDVCSLIGMVIDQAHPAIVDRKKAKKKTVAEKDWDRIHNIEEDYGTINLDII
ncbi:MAG: terminase family protein [Kiritimatiellae bacterium]|nr:terminase family protein [Kiritimatiellia bacterium]